MDGPAAVAAEDAEWDKLNQVNAGLTESISGAVGQIGLNYIAEEVDEPEWQGVEDLADMLTQMGLTARSKDDQLSDKSGDGFAAYVAAIENKVRHSWANHPSMFHKFGITPEKPFRGFGSASDQWGFPFAEIPDYFQTTPIKKGWVYMVRSCETWSGRLLPVVKIGACDKYRLGGRMRDATNLSAFSHFGMHWVLIAALAVDNVLKVEEVLHHTLHFADIPLGKEKQHASEQFFVNDAMLKYLANLFSALPRTISPWAEHAVDKDGEQKGEYTLHKVMVLNGGRYAGDPGGEYDLYSEMHTNVNVQQGLCRATPFAYQGKPRFPSGNKVPLYA